jgi:hypothetical protein
MPILVGLFALLMLMTCVGSLVLALLPRLRFLALYVALGGIGGELGGAFSSFGLAVLAEKDFHGKLLPLFGFLGGLLGGAGLGSILGLLLAYGITRLFRATVG